MMFFRMPLKTWSMLAATLLFCTYSHAHNGKIAYARPLGTITVDGNLSDWPQQATRYNIETFISGTKPVGDSDLSGFFQVGYRLDNRSLYIAFTITDDDFIEDTSAKVRFNTQDCLELCLDARHLPFGSGVASFMYSKKLRNVNNAYFDPFAKAATWNIMDVASERKGNMRYYEWRISLGEQLVVGKSVGLDFNVFDKDTDGSFTSSSWGKGGWKFRIPGNLGDVVLLSDEHKMSTVKGEISWDRKLSVPLPHTIRLTSAQHPSLWFTAEVDSSGNYSTEIPEGKYEVKLPDPYIHRGDSVFATTQKKALLLIAKAGQKTTLEKLFIPGTPVPDLLPEKGVLHNFNTAAAKQIDVFIDAYQKYCGIPGVSLALIKDGKVVYHKTYGVKNTITAERVEENTLFEAASVTKPVFAFAVQRLAERGVIDLDKPLYEYLPYPDIAYDDRYKLITARHVLTHRTGFPN